METLSDDTLTQILSAVDTTALCAPGRVCAAVMRLVAKRWKKIIALRVTGKTTIAMAIHESWYFGNQPTMKFVAAHPYSCRAHKAECLRVPDKSQSPDSGREARPMTTVENPTHYLWVHTATPSVSPRYVGGGLQMAAFDTGRRLVHIAAGHSTTFTCERDPSLWSEDSIYPPPYMTNPPATSQTCLALQVGVQMSGGLVMSFMVKPVPEWKGEARSQIGNRI